MSTENSPSKSQLVLRSNCNSLIPVTATVSQLKSSYEQEETSIHSSARTVERSPDIHPVVFRSLQKDTNIAHPPDNWLKTSNQWEKLIKRYLRSRSSTSGTAIDELAQSFQLANEAIDVLPYIDVVSNSENLKSLLRVPYDNDQILSLAIHRVGQTFLIDSFDAYAYLLDAQRSDWQWISKWFTENDEKRMTLLLAANSNRNRARTREKIRERDMLSKFLYYSIEENEYPVTVRPSQPDATPLVTPPPESLVSQPAAPGANVVPTFTSKSSLHKTAIWSLEDLQLLVGSDLPIFSTGNHPCFSLRLCDKMRPINVITGLDYWLDNLMCNVPEVLMCYHMDGIVQQYQVFKTEDLPNLSDECRFSPHVVKDFAINILSFLRSNATKEGHTYWLLKEPDLDVVKLYDLTSLCEDFMDSVNDNPFTLPLAVLLCRMAYTILERSDSTYDQMSSVPRLLNSCLRLVDRSRYPWLYSVINYLHYIAATKRSLTAGQPEVNGCELKLLQNGSPSKFQSDLPLEEKSLLNLEYIANGLAFVLAKANTNDNHSNLAAKTPLLPNVPVRWTDDQQNTMVTKLLRGGVCCYLHVAALDFDALVARQGGVIVDGNETETCLCVNVRQNLRLAHDCLLALQSKTNNQNVEPGLRCAILQLIGDLHFVRESDHCNCVFPKDTSFSNSETVTGGTSSLLAINQTVSATCAKILQSQQSFDANYYKLIVRFIGDHNTKSVCWPKWTSHIERIESAITIYELAFEGCEDKAALVRRMANACVEFANAIISRSLELFSNDKSDSAEPLNVLWKRAYFAFDKAALLFESVRPVDVENLAVVESNRARLMRVCAYCEPKSSAYFLNEAARRYGIALKHLTSSTNTPKVLISRIRWDLSTVYLTLADEELNQDGDEEVDRSVLKHLQDSSLEATASGLPEMHSRESDISFREAKVRKKMLLRLISSGTDSKLCANYMRLAEKSFEKALTSYAALDRWDDWAATHAELSGLFLEPALCTNHSPFSRKVVTTKIGAELRSIVDVLTTEKSKGRYLWQSFPAAAFSLICSVLSKLFASTGEQRPALVTAIGEACKKLNDDIVVNVDKNETGDISILMSEISDIVKRLRFS